jgi:hypothetical protein
MPGNLACRMVIWLARQIVPAAERTDWTVRWTSKLCSLQILVGRGEFPRDNSTETGWLCGATCADAFRTRSVEFDLQKWLRGPLVALAAIYGLVLALAACTRGFTITRLLIAEGGERFLPYAVVIAFGLLISMTIAFRGRAPLRGHNWRYWAFLLLKTGALVAFLSLLWIEGGFTLRRHLANDTIRALGGGLLLTLTYHAAVGWAVLWCLGDQQRRCPVCLRRMAAPVRIGSWASVFEPVITELLCDEGHGALCVQECEMGEPDRWVAMEMIP